MHMQVIKCVIQVSFTTNDNDTRNGKSLASLESILL
jgi:hypothetical protein